MITELRKIDMKIDTRGTPTHLIMSLMLIIIHVLVIIITLAAAGVWHAVCNKILNSYDVTL